MSGPARFRWRRLIVAAAAVMVLPALWAASAGADHGPTTFRARSTLEVASTRNGGATSVTTAASDTHAAASAETGGGTAGGFPFTGGDVIAVGLIAVGLLVSSVGLSGGRRRPYPYARLSD